MAELLEASDTAVQEALLPTGRRGADTPMAVLKRLCDGNKERLTSRLSLFSVQSKVAGVQLSPKCAPSTIVMPAELFSLAVALTALTLYTQADQHRGWVAPESVANAMRAWVFMPRALGNNAAWGAVTVKDVGDTLTSFKPDGTHSVIGGLLRCRDTQLGKLTTAGLMFLMSWLPPTLIPIDATAEARCAFATSNSPRALLLSRKDVYYFLRGVALTGAVSSSVHAVSSASVAVPGGQSTVGSSPGSGSAAPAVLRTLPTAAAMAPTLAPITPASLNEEHDSSDSDSGSDGSEWDEHDSEGHTRGVGSAFKCSAVYSRPDKTHVAVYACTRNGRPSGDVRSSQTSTSLPPARLPPPPRLVAPRGGSKARSCKSERL